MNYRALIRQRFPFVESVLKANPALMQTAIKIESLLLRRRLKAATQGFLISQSSPILDEGNLLAEAKKQGLFDFNWYSQTQNREFKSENQAFSDYLHKSTFSTVSPSPNFDNALYQKRNIDVYHSNISPLAHYVQFGQNEGRISSSFSPKWTPRDKLAITPDLKKLGQLKLAVCLHVFYADFIDYYAECLSDFPLKVDLFISVSDMSYQADILAKLACLDSVGQVIVRQVPNRGRNFAPMLVEFGKELINYDLFCHLHSKKSLYSGRPQTQWADYLGEYLLHDHCVIMKMLTYMMENKECGLYYPTSFYMMPDWVNHWLKNKAYRQRFYQDWSLTEQNEFLPYPVGGMFWARPDALKQLLEQEHKYEDFPAEPLPNDGSELHALERCIGLLAEKNNYSQLFFYPELGRFTHDKSYIFASYINSQEELFHKILPFEIVSFDIFDTLIRRRYQVPDYAKLKLGQYLCKLGRVNSAAEFVKQRNEAELNVRKSKQFKGDLDIYEVYQGLAKIYQWDEHKAKSFAELEFSYDLDMIEPKDAMVELANKLQAMGKVIYLISDTYYTEKQILRMLDKAGVAKGYQLFVSSHLGLRKDNATMWAYMSSILKNKSRFVHIGDNAVADAQLPGDFGLANLHILNPLDKWQAAGWDNPLVGDNELNEADIKKWGALISQFGCYPFLGE